LSAADHLNPVQFPRHKKPEPQEKPKFGGAPGGIKTMKVERGAGLPAAQTVHEHRAHPNRTKRSK
jgi:hypothetical protein